MLFHAENVMISTTDSYKFEWTRAPRNKESVVLEVRTEKKSGPVYVTLAENRSSSDRMYRVSIGDAGNTVTWLGRGRYGE